MNETGPVTVRRLKIWQEGMTLVEKVYLASEEWPTAEVYGLTSQVRRAAVSVPANIAEGVGRGSEVPWRKSHVSAESPWRARMNFTRCLNCPFA